MDAPPFESTPTKWYRNPLVYACIILAIIIIALILIVIFYKPKVPPDNTAKLIAQQSALFQNLSYWGPSSDVPNNPRSQCSIYTFEGFIDANGIAIQGDVTTNRSIVDTCGSTGSQCIGPQASVLQACLDADQTSLKLQQRTCTSSGTDSIGCRDFDGTRYNIGDTNIFYDPCGITPCLLSLIHI